MQGTLVCDERHWSKTLKAIASAHAAVSERNAERGMIFR